MTEKSSSYLNIQGTCEWHGSIWLLYKYKTWDSSFKEFLKRNDCVHTLFESLNDELCCARAIVTTTEYVDGDPDKQYTGDWD